LDDEAYRRPVLTQTNRGEERHRLAREVFYGRRGELRQRYREGQEDQLNALGLVLNVLVLWNTWYMTGAFNNLQKAAQTRTNPVLVIRYTVSVGTSSARSKTL
jgi:TnpA family transposase